MLIIVNVCTVINFKIKEMRKITAEFAVRSYTIVLIHVVDYATQKQINAVNQSATIILSKTLIITELLFT